MKLQAETVPMKEGSMVTRIKLNEIMKGKVARNRNG